MSFSCFKTHLHLAFSCVLLFCASAKAEVVDVLVLYTPEALETRNGADINARISSYLSYANAAYQNSQVDMQLRLVGSQLLNEPYERVTQENLQNFSRNTSVASLRRETGADLVVLLNLRQEAYGGYVCGMGYVPGGDEHEGKFYPYAYTAAYSLVGIDCGVSTFAHELGHNMGLGHSHIQNSEGGIWPWARGYGVSGLFSTIMAYPQSYGTYNQMPLFSNPDVRECYDLPCGVGHTDPEGADAARNLTALSAQIAAFMPTVISATDPIPDDGAPEGEEGNQCTNPQKDGNLIKNGEFDDLRNWQSGFGESSLRVETVNTARDCSENLLVVTDRSAFYSSASQDLAQPLNAGTRYRIEGDFGIRGTNRASIYIALRTRTATNTYYRYLNPVSATNNTLTPMSQDFTVENGEVEAVLFYGPSAGVDIVMDSVSIVPAM